MQSALLHLAAAMTALWGVAHLLATKGVVAGFGDITPDNRRIITMEWIVEGVALISIASFVLAATIIQPEARVSSAVYAVAAGTLLVLALVSLFTGFRVAFLPYRLRPLVLGSSAALWPSVSLIRLNWSRSRNSTAIGSSRRRARAIDCSSRSSSQARLGRSESVP